MGGTVQFKQPANSRESKVVLRIQDDSNIMHEYWLSEQEVKNLVNSLQGMKELFLITTIREW